MKASDLQKAIGSLPNAMKPQRDLWPGISERLEMVERSSHVQYKVPFWRMPALAASVLLALITGIFIGLGLETGSAGDPAGTVQEYALISTVNATEREYQAAFSELVSLDYSGLRLAGEEPDALRDSWEALLEAEAALMAALQQYPSNIYLNGKLLDLRSQQLQFVKQLALLEQNDWRRT